MSPATPPSTGAPTGGPTAGPTPTSDPPPTRPGLPPNPYNPLAWIIGEPSIGEGTWIGAFTVIDGSGGLQIGSGCDIGAGCQIYTHSSARRCVSGRRYGEVDRKPVTMGDRVFMGPGAMVFMGVEVGDEAVICAGAMVTRSVPPRTIVAGVPARPIGIVQFDDPASPRFVLTDPPTGQI
ncbi:MAG: acyltransferase [Bifidobacteriaceae bacterium]|jgi:acetyltransferase-like isoleucine patch superfamily enzyme|nr:acyltransferase [Bifidobacteriaceae bacterium]